MMGAVKDIPSSVASLGMFLGYAPTTVVLVALYNSKYNVLVDVDETN